MLGLGRSSNGSSMNRLGGDRSGSKGGDGRSRCVGRSESLLSNGSNGESGLFNDVRSGSNDLRNSNRGSEDRLDDLLNENRSRSGNVRGGSKRLNVLVLKRLGFIKALVDKSS